MIHLKPVTRRQTAISLLCAFFVGGCSPAHPRPSGVPSSAVWVDHTFIQCSPELASTADRCTVYKEGIGEIVADGLWVIPATGRAADPNDLQYAAFGIEGIYLSNAQVLSQKTASSHDPSHRIVVQRLKELASKKGGNPITCNAIAYSAEPDAVIKCAEDAIATKTPFYISSYRQHEFSFSLIGIAGDAQGHVSELVYASGRTTWTGRQGESGQLQDNNRIMIMPCPKPVRLDRDGTGIVSCAWPKS